MGKKNVVQKRTKRKSLSKVKKASIHHAKLAKKGKLKKRKISTNEKKKRAKKIENQASGSSENLVENQTIEHEKDLDEDDLLGMIDEEDLQYMLQKHKSKYPSKKDDNVEEDYEKDFASKSSDVPTEENIKLLLPIKSKKGIIKRTMELTEEQDAYEFDPTNSSKEPLPPKTTVELFADRMKLIEETKVEIGASCCAIMENPPERLQSLAHVIHYLDIKDESVALTIKKITALSLLELFNDILPGYKIVVLESKNKMKKETRKLQHFEQTLLVLYKSYLVKLEKWASVLRRKDPRSVSLVNYNLGVLGLRCLTQLLVQHPDFNYAPNIVNCIVPFMNHSDETVSSIPCDGIKQMFKSDKFGGTSLKCVRKISQLVKSRNDRVKPKVLDVFLCLNIMNIDLDKEKEEYLKQKRSLTHKEKLMKMSKRERKRNKLKDELEKDLLSMEADKAKNKKSEIHTNIIQTVFTIYFRVLKTAPKSTLVGSVLAGLSKFAHLINVDFFQDLITVLHDLISVGHLTTKQQLHCVNVVFTILSGQGEALLIDPYRFYVQCYSSLFSLADGNNSDDVSMLLKSLHEMLIQRRKKISLMRVFAYTKRLSTISLTLDHSGSLGVLLFIRVLLNTFSKLDLLLDLETPVGGVYDPYLDNPDYCGASSSRLWELCFLEHSYHPDVRMVAKFLSKFTPGTMNEANISMELARKSPNLVTELYSFKEKIRFIPPIPTPEITKAKVAKHKDSNVLRNKELEGRALQLLGEAIPMDIDYYIAPINKPG